MDSHHRNHIAHAVFWVHGTDNTRVPIPFQKITAAEVESEEWVPRDPSLKEHCKYYTRELEKKGNYTLTIWPEHCLIGSPGHCVIDNVHEALMDW
jgi:nicotinamidase-related amidase